MDFPELDDYLTIETKKDLFRFWFAALEYRKLHQDIERNLAHFIFTTSLEAGRRMSEYDDQLNAITFEFGALEAPGMPDDESIHPELYSDQLWNRLDGIVRKAYNN